MLMFLTDFDDFSNWGTLRCAAELTSTLGYCRSVGFEALKNVTRGYGNHK